MRGVTNAQSLLSMPVTQIPIPSSFTYGNIRRVQLQPGVYLYQFVNCYPTATGDYIIDNSFTPARDQVDCGILMGSNVFGISATITADSRGVVFHVVKASEWAHGIAIVTTF